ncbi:hypothetical protein I308_105992 [Cryptococcus tetragattii IND107]|uniref:Pali-domain-containing protein n=1 Tax=Cryptococcus tetragattii IND107 TaxID=1296105 RepID=A0ABR3BN96_9TREE
MALGPIHSTISAPVIHNISFLDITTGSSKATFGVFGYCSNIVGSDICSGRQIGYNIADVTGNLTDYTYVNNSLENVTKAFILHPIACGIAFLSFLIALCSDHLGFLFAAFVALLAFLVSLVVMIIDFVVFGLVKHEVSKHTTASADFSAAIWLVLAATIILFFSTFVVCFSCCTNRRRVRDREYQAAPMRQGRWWHRA